MSPKTPFRSERPVDWDSGRNRKWGFYALFVGWLGRGGLGCAVASARNYINFKFSARLVW